MVSLALTLVMLVLTISSCEDNNVDTPQEPDKFLLLEKDTLYVNYKAVQNVPISVSAPDNLWQWSQDEASKDWFSVSETTDQLLDVKSLVLSVTENTTGASRQAAITLFYTNSTVSNELTLIQTSATDESATTIKCTGSVSLEKALGTYALDVVSDGAYTVEIPEKDDWIQAAGHTKTEGGFAEKFNYDANFGEYPRSTVITLKSDYASASVEVRQAGTLDAVMSKTEFMVGYKKGVVLLPVEVFGDAECSAKSDASWLVVDKALSKKDTVAVAYSTNETAAQRVATVTITVGNTIINASVKQVPFKEYEAVDADTYVADIVLAVAKCEASSQLSTGRGSVQKAYDKSDISWWATDPTTSEPASITFEFDEKQTATRVDYLRYCPPTSLAWGQWGKVELYLTLKGEAEKLYATYNFGESETPTVIAFEQPLPATIQKATFKILTATPFSETITGCASAGEISFCQYNPDSFHATDIFTDESCSAIKPSVDYEQIEAIKDLFYRSMAERIFNGDYDKYRVYTAKAYPHPDRDAEIFRTNTMTLLDNVTGMYVAKANTPQYIYLDEDYGQKIYVRVVDWVGDEGLCERIVGNCASDYRIYKGRNVITPGFRGLMYIIWHTDDYENLKPITVNFANSCVNGYYNMETDNPADFYKIISLGGPTEPHFDMISNRVFMNFAKQSLYTWALKNNPANSLRAARLVTIYDTVAKIQETIQGHIKYKALGLQRGHRNRAPFTTTYGDTYGASGAYRTCYGYKNMALDMCDPDALWDLNATTFNNNVVGKVWGLAHELGHSNQTNQFCWRGLAEVTNNLMCTATQVAFYGEGNTTTRFNDHFNRAMRDIVTRWMIDPDGSEHHITHCESVNTPSVGAREGGVDPTTQLEPFWQLYMYYHLALGKTDFYPDFYELCRLDRPMVFRDWDETSTLDQEYAMLHFMVKISQAAGEDLSDFCAAWQLPGLNNKTRVSHYGQTSITTTQAQLDEMAALCHKYPKPKLNPLYINDLNIDLYRNPKPVIAGTHSVSAYGVYQMSGWSNVAAWVLVDPVTGRDMGIYQATNNAIVYRYYKSQYVKKASDVTNRDGSDYKYTDTGYNRYLEATSPVMRNDLLVYGVAADGTRVASTANSK